MQDIQRFENMLSSLDITLSDRQINQFISFYELLIETNKVMNLTAITEFNEVVCKHFIDSLSIVKVFHTDKNIRVLDMGTGAGFPGIPLKILYPNWKFVLLDSLNKRVNFLNEVINKLELEDIFAIHGRAEEYGRKDEYREGFDLCVSRAVAKLSTLSEYCLPYVNINGYFIPYKAGNLENELEQSENAIKILGGNIERTESFYLPDTDIERSLVVIKKLTNTPKTYPRSGGKPANSPL